MTGIKENGIKQCYRADKRNTLLEASLKVLFITFGRGATLKNQRMAKMPKMKMAALFGKILLSQLLHYLESHVWGQN